MATSKERLLELKKQKAKIYYKEIYGVVETMIENGSVLADCLMDNCGYGIDFNDLYETKAEAQWHADNDTERKEYFCPPMELKHDHDKFVFDIPHGEGQIMRWDWGMHNYEVTWSVYDKYLDEKGFDTYPEAVAYARKLFKGEV